MGGGGLKRWVEVGRRGREVLEKRWIVGMKVKVDDVGIDQI